MALRKNSLSGSLVPRASQSLELIFHHSPCARRFDCSPPTFRFTASLLDWVDTIMMIERTRSRGAKSSKIAITSEHTHLKTDQLR